MTSEHETKLTGTFEFIEFFVPDSFQLTENGWHTDVSNVASRSGYTAMKRTSCVIMLLITITGSGCTKSLLNTQGLQSMLKPDPPEQRVVERFRDALREENEPALRRISSTRFEAVALRSDDVLSDLRVMHLPKGELSVVDVQKVSDSEKLVVAKEDNGGRYQFRLVDDPTKGYWTVDDIMVRRRHKGTQVTKSTTEVMDLLVTVRSFLNVWETGEQSSILTMTSPRLRKSLERLPSGWMTALAKKIAAAYEDGMARKPDASLNENDAIVKLPARNGHLLMTVARISDQWLVDDIEFQNHRDDNHPGSIRRQADAINTVTSFLQAYQESNHEKLKFVTEDKFYRSSLRLANLNLIPLPSAEQAPEEFVIRAYEQQLSFMLPAGRQIIRVDLREQQSEIPEAARNKYMPDADDESRFLVREVTVYEKGSTEQRSLSAVFTAPERATLFLKALQSDDKDTLTHLCTNDFSKTVWQRLDSELSKQLPIPDFYDDQIQLVKTQSIGNRSELEFKNTAGRVLVCQLVVEAGVLKVADVQYPNDQGMVTSLKSTLQLAAPVIEFANAWMTADSEMLQKACSADFNRLVWSHLDGVPKQFPELPFQLRSAKVKTTVTQERATMNLAAQDGRTTTVTLLAEHGHWVIDEIRIPQEGNRIVGLRQSLREKITTRILNGDATNRIVRHSPRSFTPQKAKGETEAEASQTVMAQAPTPDDGDFPEVPQGILPVNFEQTESTPSVEETPHVDSAHFEQAGQQAPGSAIRFADYARVVSEQPTHQSPRRPSSVTPLQNLGGQIGLPSTGHQQTPEASKFQLLGGSNHNVVAKPAQSAKDFQLPGDWGPELRQPADLPIPIPN